MRSGRRPPVRRRRRPVGLGRRWQPGDQRGLLGHDALGQLGIEVGEGGGLGQRAVDAALQVGGEAGLLLALVVEAEQLGVRRFDGLGCRHCGGRDLGGLVLGALLGLLEQVEQVRSRCARASR